MESSVFLMNASSFRDGVINTYFMGCLELAPPTAARRAADRRLLRGRRFGLVNLFENPRP